MLVDQDGEGNLVGVDVVPDEVCWAERDEHDIGVLTEVVESVAHGERVIETRQSSQVPVEDHQDGATSVIAEAPWPTAVVCEEDVGTGLADRGTFEHGFVDLLCKVTRRPDPMASDGRPDADTVATLVRAIRDEGDEMEPGGPIQTWMIGDVKVTKVVEGIHRWRGTTLLPDATPEAMAPYSSWLVPDFVTDKGRLLLSIHALVVEAGNKRIVVDTCVGNDKDRGDGPFTGLQTTFLDDMTAAGFAPDSIDTVICTHLHVDHVGWNTHLVDGQWVPTFVNAEHVINQVEYDHWDEVGDEGFGDVMGDSVRPVVEAGLANFVGADHRICDEVWLEPTPGHTPGHTSVHISSAGSEAVITGDMIHSPVQFANPDWHCFADTDVPLGQQTRHAFVETYCDTDTVVLGTHFAGPTAGMVRTDGDGRCFRGI